MLFTNIYPPSDDQNMVFVYLGCLTFCVLVSYVFLQWAGISSNMAANYQNIITDIIINAVMGAIAGAVIALVISKIK